MIKIINALIAKLGSGLQALLLLLPQSPFDFTYNIDNSFIKMVNYVLPFSQAVAHLSAYISAVIIYYGLRIVLRWIKAAGD